MITLTREEAQQVLDALDGHSVYKVEAAIEFFRARLAQPEPNVSYAGNGTAGIQNDTKPTGFFFQMPKPKPEPVAWAVVDGDKIEHVSHTRADSESWLRYRVTRKLVSFYTAPPQREWVGLTDEERTYLAWESNNGPHCVAMTEAKLKEKNL
jgi:hypothetical protein